MNFEDTPNIIGDLSLYWGDTRAETESNEADRTPATYAKNSRDPRGIFSISPIIAQFAKAIWNK